MSVDPIYVDLATESDDPSVTQIDSLCIECHDQGVTRLLMTRIPHFREVILTSFECNSCGNSNRGVDLGSMMETGISYELTVVEQKDLSRQVVKSDKSHFKIPQLDFESEAKGGGEITTVEGLISKVRDNLEQGQEARRSLNAELAERIEAFISRLDSLLQLSEQFTIIIDDCTGNSFIESLTSPKIDPQLKISHYPRTNDHFKMLGITPQESHHDQLHEIKEEDIEDDLLDLQEDILKFSTNCNSCSRPCFTNMKVTRIPHFKEVIIMATSCDFCGFKSNEVKSGGGISEKAVNYTVMVEDIEDLSRDILKSETCSISIPEVDLDVGAGILVGKFTTVEGLIRDIKEDLGRNSFLMGDSSTSDTKNRMESLLTDLQKVIDGKLNVQLILDDPAGNSYVQNLMEPEIDPKLKVTHYERTSEQNEDLGLNQMKTENYAQED